MAEVRIKGRVPAGLATFLVTHKVEIVRCPSRCSRVLGFQSL